MTYQDVSIARIKVGRRHRVERGDIDALAANIRELGLLQPIGVDRFYQLIFGWRRLEACKCVLKWEHIPAVVLDIDSLIAGEYAENEFRKQFTSSERTNIGKAIEAELGNRKGERTDLGSIDPKSEKGRSADIAARRVGFADRQSFQRAKVVVAKGAPELIEAMDAGDIKIDAAAKIASQPKAEQKRIVEMPKDEQREVV